jgi:Cys-Gly metallodipeptidase DUG1
VGWLNVLKYHNDNNKELPVNLRYCFEGMEESGSVGLDDKIKQEAEEGGWFHGVDAVCIVSRLFVLLITPFR